MKEWDIGVKDFCNALLLVTEKIKGIVMSMVGRAVWLKLEMIP